MIHITEHAEGCILPVRAQPGARKAGIVGEHAGALKVAVTAPPNEGRANQALVELLAKALKLKRAQVQLWTGPTSREKKFLIQGVSKKELETQLTTLFAART